MIIPFWVKTPPQAEEIRQKTVNARAETMYEKPAFRQSTLNNHCLVLADGFFEWYEYLGEKFPYYIKLKSQEPFAMAGLWDTWKNPATGELVKTYTIITTEANTLMQTIHNTKKRMPVILKKTVEHEWLTKELPSEEVKPMLVPFDDGLLEAFTISKLITTKGKDQNVPEVVQPYQYPGVRPRY
jgi:putative SOS response-associated peptidase YedK